ncbi:MAG: DUF4038 domain-containing protein [Polyangiales bacterium]
MRTPSFALAAFTSLVAITSTARAATVEQWHPIDLSFNATSTPSAPYTASVTATLSGPGGVSLSVPAFFDGGSTWLVRASAPSPGMWTVTTHSSTVASLEGQTASFTAVANTNPKVHGVVRVDPARPTQLRFDDGSPYFPSGYECDWLWALGLVDGTMTTADALLDKLAGDGFNQILVQAFAYDTGWRAGTTGPDDFGPPPMSAWGGTHAAPDYATFNLAYWRHYDAMMSALLDRGIAAHVILRVYNKQVVWPANGSTNDDAYYAWIVARYAAYPNVVWDFSKEAQHESDTAYKQARLKYLGDADGYHHLRTVHDDKALYDSGAYDGLVELRTDQTHANYHASIVTEQGVAKWPVLNAEYGYEYGPKGPSDVTYAGSDSPETMSDRAWQIALGGGFGAYYYTYTAWDVVRPDDTPPGYAYLKHFTDFFATTAFWDLKPADSTVKLDAGATGKAYALANEGVEYVAYESAAAGLSLTVSGAASALEVRWFQPLTGAWQDGTSIGAGVAHLSPPTGWSGPVALHVGKAVTAPSADAGVTTPSDAGVGDASAPLGDAGRASDASIAVDANGAGDGSTDKQADPSVDGGCSVGDRGSQSNARAIAIALLVRATLPRQRARRRSIASTSAPKSGGSEMAAFARRDSTPARARS